MSEPHDLPSGSAPLAPDAAAQALDRMPEGVCSLAADGTVLYANAAALHLAQRTRAQIVGRSVWEAFPYLRASALGEHFARAVASGQVVEFEDFAPSVGRWLWRRLYPRDDGVTVIMGERALPGLTEEEGAELRRSLVQSQITEARYRDLLDSMTEGVVETTPAGAFVAVNHSYAAMLGYSSPEDLIARVGNVAELYVSPAQRDGAVASVAAGASGPIDVQMRRRTGGTVWIRARATPKHAATGELVSIQAVVRDITEQREADRFLQEHEDRIAERERALLAEAVHDNPLQLVAAAILRLDSLQAQLPETAQPAVDQITGLLEQAVDGLRHVILSASPPDMSSGLGAALRVLAEDVFTGTTTQVDVTGPLHVQLPVETKEQAYRILREALINVRKHAAASNVLITLLESSGRVAVAVTDDGIGGATATSDPGHLGMTTMRARATAVGGTLTISSAPGQGTTVELDLPRNQAS